MPVSRPYSCVESMQYYNKEGKLTQEKTLDSMWGDPLKFFAMLNAMREEGRVFEGVDVDLIDRPKL